MKVVTLKEFFEKAEEILKDFELCEDVETIVETVKERAEELNLREDTKIYILQEEDADYLDVVDETWYGVYVKIFEGGYFQATDGISARIATDCLYECTKPYDVGVAIFTEDQFMELMNLDQFEINYEEIKEKYGNIWVVTWFNTNDVAILKIVTNVPDDVDEDDIRTFFEERGDVPTEFGIPWANTSIARFKDLSESLQNRVLRILQGIETSGGHVGKAYIDHVDVISYI